MDLKKSLYIGIGIVLVFILGFMVRGYYIKNMISEVSGVKVDQHLNGSTTYSSNQGTVTVGNNKLPENWPADVPVYVNAAISQSFSFNPQTTGMEGCEVMFTTSDNTQKVTDFYKKGLSSSGWTVNQGIEIGTMTSLTAKKDTRYFSVSISDEGNGQVRVTITVGTAPKIKVGV